MFAEFLNIIFKSIRLDKSLYKDSKNFGEATIYFAGLIMILDGIAGAVAANTIIKTAIAMSGLTAILTWLVWAIFIYVIGVKLFPENVTAAQIQFFTQVVALFGALIIMLTVSEYKPIDSLNDFHNIHWNWVKGHSGHPGNEKADALANLGIEKL